VSQPPDLAKLSSAEKDELILALFAQLAAAHEKITALEARIDELTRPPKTPDNSSKPHRRGRSRTGRSPPASAHPAKAAPASAGRCTLTRTA
jgi:hypothetical protein